MKLKANTKFKIAGWDEKPFSQVQGAGKLTKASILQTFEGDVSGKGTLELVMSYNNDGTASFVGYERIEGRVGKRSGSFVVMHEGTYDGKLAKTCYVVVPNSGTGELVGIKGKGDSSAGQEDEHPMTLEFDLP